MNETPLPASTPARQTHLGALMMGLFLLVNAAMLVTSAPILGILGLTTLRTPEADQSVSLFMLAVGSFSLGLLLLPGLYLNARRFFNAPEPVSRLRGIPTLPALIVLGFIWVVTLGLGHFITQNQTLTTILLPLFNIIAVLLPVAMVLFIALNKLPMPTARRGWSVFGASAVLSPFLTIILEMFAFAAILIWIFLYASGTPGLDTTLNTIIAAAQNGETSLDSLSQEATALLLAPGTTFALIGLFSLLVPIIEEGLKIVLLWFYADRIQRPLDGFVLGALCGAAFALAENIGFASAGADNWAINMISRASATLPHIFNCGLMGWALVSAWQKKSYARLFVAYLTVILVHGTWNALSIALAYSSFSGFVADIPAVIETPIPAAITWGVLIIGLIGGLLFANRQMRKRAASESGENVG